MAPKKNLMENYDDGTLDLSLSSIQEIPVRDIAAIPKAVNLDLSSNTIVSIPKSFATSLTRLVQLDLSHNQIESLPENFGLLVNLKHLELDNNKIVSLPLSFGNLKSLRWLDLKRNPLMPKLAQIAGLCLDAKQCQAAARNVVAALRDMQDQVNAEINRRKEKQNKKLEQSEEFENKEKEQHTKKKKKKKGANGAISDSVNTNEENSLNYEADVKNSAMKHEQDELSPLLANENKRGFFSKLGSVFKSIFKTLVMSILVIALFSFLLSLIDEERYLFIKKKSSNLIRTNLPKPYLKRWDKGLAVAQKSLTVWFSQATTLFFDLINKLQDYTSAVSNDETVQQYMQSVKSGWHIMWIWLQEKYATLPQYISSFQETAFESTPNAS